MKGFSFKNYFFLCIWGLGIIENHGLRDSGNICYLLAPSWSVFRSSTNNFNSGVWNKSKLSRTLKLSLPVSLTPDQQYSKKICTIAKNDGTPFSVVICNYTDITAKFSSVIQVKLIYYIFNDKKTCMKHVNLEWRFLEKNLWSFPRTAIVFFNLFQVRNNK